MRIVLAFAASLGCLFLSARVGAEAWKPARGPLMTRWANDVSPENAHPEYPRPQMVRPRWLNLNGVWQLALGKPEDAVPSGKELPRRILVPFPVESALSGVMEQADRLWYRRTFQVPEAWKGDRVLLHFQAVDWEATVFVNGKELGTHRGGYDAFSFDITDALKPGAEQELIVKVFDPTDQGNQPRGKQVLKPHGIWYTPSTGIWQTVWLEPVRPAHIESLKIVPDVDGGKVRVAVRCKGVGDQHRVQLSVEDPSTQRPTSQGARVEVVAGRVGRPGEVVELPIPDAKLWSPDRPFLYNLQVRLLSQAPAAQNAGEVLDTVAGYFGMRKIDLAKDKDGVLRLRLNGEFLFQIGPLDQGFWPDGLYTAPTDEALRYDIEVTRRLGFNMARKHVKIEPARWYYWCDKLGLLVWQDMPSGNNATPESKRQFEQELVRLVEGFGNHPSIIMWVVFNEGWGQHDTERYVERVKKLDPSRLVNNASGWTDKKVGDVHDIHAYPGPAAPEPEPGRAGVLGEFGGLGLGVDGHTWTQKTWGYRGTASSEELTHQYVRLLRNVWMLQQSRGLSAAVYTQTTDVETECNGLMTYDRAVVKVDAEKVAAANRGRVPKLELVVPTSQGQGLVWRYTFDKPADDWFQPGFDDSAWKEGPGGFGTAGTPGAIVRTEWKSPDIWLRRTFEMPETKGGDLALLVHHDEDVEIYINGVLAARAKNFTTNYEDLPLTPEGRAALKPGKNLMAVHCRQTRGGQYIDLGLTRLVGDDK